ncbi:MAG: filamentous hemagglutinin N-terminal domain-containing protein, partial [Methylotenera sp.]|nr:filamentous hemagglutinin N-terminal domain-containing protein [Methylotenera sp.]
MNKTRFRIIFNKARGMLMAVAEHIANAGKSVRTSDASAKGHVSQANHTTVTLKPTHFAVLCHLGLVSFVGLSILANPAHADIIADQTAPANQRPVIINAPNGVPLVNIQTPSAAGVSRNTYSQFNVNTKGAILNNSRTNVQTQLGGWVQGNPYLATGSARIILNEVNSHNPSLLNGYVEVAGSRAQVVIANPAGISCNGCGFINASRTTLTTGTPIINNGDLMGYRVGGGAINFLGAGLDTANSNYTDVIARAVNVNAGLWAQNLNIITGSNQVNVASNGDVTGITTISPNATLPDGSSNPTPGFAIDVAALGGMYAGKIHMIGTEAGVGVRNAGSIGASVGEVTIDVNGNLTNSNRISSTTQTNINTASISNTGGTITAGQLLNINTNSLTGDGQLLSGGDATVTLSSDYTQTSTGELQANGNLTFTTTGNLTNQGSLLAGGTLSLNAVNIDNTATAEITGLNTQINVSNTLTNRGVIDGSDTFINANVLNNIGTGSIFGDHIALSATTLNNDTETVNGVTTAAVIAARNQFSQLDIGATNITNRENALIFSAGNLAIGGALDANHQATGQAATLNNTSATIEALGNLSLNVASINNTNTHLTTQYVRTSIASTLAESVDVRGNMGSPAPAAGNTRQYQLSYFSTDGALLFGRIYNYDEVDHFYLDGSGFAHLVLKAGVANDGMTDANTFMQFNSGSIVYETQILTTKPGQILAGNNLQINADSVLNSDSKMIAGGTFNANVVTLNNQETLGS